MVYVKIHSDTDKVKVKLLKDDEWCPDPSLLWYLFDKIREFCPEDDRDVTCPEPTLPRPPRSRAGTPAVEDDDSPSSPLPWMSVTKLSVCTSADDTVSLPPTKKT